MKRFEVAILQGTRSCHDGEQSLRALDLPFDFDAELAERMSQSFIDMDSFRGSPSRRQYAGQNQGRRQDYRNEQAKAASEREPLQAGYPQVSPERGRCSS